MKSKSIVRCYALLALSVLSLVLAGCAATQVALEHKDLNVQSQMSATVFLDVEAPTEKTVFVDIKNTSDKDFDMTSLIKARLEQKGYTIVASAQQAAYVIQANVLQVGMTNPSALHDSLYAGWGGPLAGGLAGALVGANRTSNSFAGAMNGAGVGGLLGAAGELVAGSLVKDVTYSMITDVQIMERSNATVAQTVQSNLQQGTSTHIVQSNESTSNWKKYQTRIASTANKVNLTFSEALPHLQEQLAKSLAGIL